MNETCDGRYTLEALRDPATYQDPEVSEIVRYLGNHQYDALGRGRMSRGEFKAALLRGEFAKAVLEEYNRRRKTAARSEAGRKAAQTRVAKRAESAVVPSAPSSLAELPEGSVRTVQIQVVARKQKYLTARYPGGRYEFPVEINSESAGWTAGETVTAPMVVQTKTTGYGTRTMMVPITIALASEVAEKMRRDRNRGEAEALVASIERYARDQGWFPDLKADKVRRLVGDLFDSRLRAAAQLAGEVRAAKQAAARIPGPASAAPAPVRAPGKPKWTHGFPGDRAPQPNDFFEQAGQVYVAEEISATEFFSQREIDDEGLYEYEGVGRVRVRARQATSADLERLADLREQQARADRASPEVQRRVLGRIVTERGQRYSILVDDPVSRPNLPQVIHHARDFCSGGASTTISTDGAQVRVVRYYGGGIDSLLDSTVYTLPLDELGEEGRHALEVVIGAGGQS